MVDEATLQASSARNDYDAESDVLDTLAYPERCPEAPPTIP